MTAYELVPVGPSGADLSRAQVVDVPTYRDLLYQNERLKQYLEAAKEDVSTYRQMWAAAHDERLKAETRATRAARVLASIERMSPRAADLVEVARRYVWRLDR